MLKNFCFMRLKTAGIVMGLHDLVACFVMTIALLFIWQQPDVIVKRIAENMGEVDPNVYEEIHLYNVVFYRVALGVFVFHILASGLLIWGTIKERDLMLLLFLTSYVVLFFIGILFLVASIFTPMKLGGVSLGLFFSVQSDPHIDSQLALGASRDGLDPRYTDSRGNIGANRLPAPALPTLP